MKGCIFCQIAQNEASSWKVLETEDICAFFDINPVNPYHTLVIPKAHYENIFDVPLEVLQKMMVAIKHITTRYRTKLGLRNIQIVSNSGAEAQQDVFHLHFHLVPRKYGDQQNIHWHSHPELRKRFDEFLRAIE